MRSIITAVAWLLAASSAVATTAAEALLEAAKHELAAGRPQQASLLLERSLQLEPGDPAAWHYLGVAHLAQGHYAQAEAMAAKSHTLAAADGALRKRNAGLMAEAQRASGKPVNVPSGEPPLSAWQRMLTAPIELARTYVDPERPDDAERRQPLPSADSAALTLRARPSRGWRRLEPGTASRQRNRRQR